MNKHIGTDLIFVAEIGNNHNGDFDKACELVLAAKNAGADFVKFQMRSMPDLYREKTLLGEPDDLGVEYVLDLLEKYQLTEAEHREIFSFCRSEKISYMCTPWDERSADVLIELGVQFFKIASADLPNLRLIRKCCEKAKYLFISTGMSYQWEIDSVMDQLKEYKHKIAFLHSNSCYPSPFGELNLNYIEKLKAKWPSVGYSGHERGYIPTLAAISLGAKTIERHITLDKTLEGPDHEASLLPSEFKSMVDDSLILIKSLGSNKSDRQISQGELINRENLGKSILAATKIKQGDVFREEYFEVKSPGRGLSPLKIPQLVGLRAIRDIDAGEFLEERDLVEEKPRIYDFSFKRPWGIPVRFHDYHLLLSEFNPDFVEFHLSYKDMSTEITNLLPKKSISFFAVHAPELFEGSKIIDLTSQDSDYLDFSIGKIRDVIELTKKLSFIGNLSMKPTIVVNVGGFSVHKKLSSVERAQRYDTVHHSLRKLDLSDVQLCPQTSAPHPWHFGGQRYQNLLLKPAEIRDFCTESGLKICLDISHTAMAAAEFGFDLCNAVREIGSHVGHLHISDSSGIHGEGLQIGEGDVEFPKLAKVLKEVCPDVPFIPEVWQGHVNNGSGFYLGLKRLAELGLE